MRSRSVVAPLLAVCLGACSPSVGDTCDEDAARTPYYRMSDGAPAYPGQALILENCAECHNDPGTLGAPLGLEMDAALVTAGGEEGVQQARRLLARQAIIHRHRDIIYSQVVDGAMPPRGRERATTTYADEDGTELPNIRSAEAHEMLRNWLACDSPVVERTSPLASPCSEHSDCVVTNFCDTATSLCVGVGDVVPALGDVDCNTVEPTWQWIYPCVIATTCSGASCHIGGAGGGLRLEGIDSAYEALVEMGPSPAPNQCAGGPQYVIPEMPDASLLVHKIEGVDAEGATVCGSRMPVGPMLSADQIDAIRAWIMAGAHEEE